MKRLNYKKIETERLVLRKPLEDDYQSHFAYVSDAANFPFADMKEIKSLDEVKNYFKKMKQGMQSGEWLFWVIADATSNKALGTLSLWNVNKSKASGEFGFGLYADSRGQGYMTEALSAAVNFCFTDLEMKTLQGWTSSDNKAAINTLKQSEFIYLKTEFEDAYSHNDEIEYHVYQISKK